MARRPVRFVFWGVRGSLPSPGRGTIHYGGNTPCLAADLGGELLVLDAGSGIRILGTHLVAHGRATGNRVTLLLSHTHWDHIQGLPFFAAALIRGNRIRIFGPRLHHLGLARVLSHQMEHAYFPIRMDDFGANVEIREFGLGRQPGVVRGVGIETFPACHPVAAVGYRLTVGRRRLVYLPDCELPTDAYLAHVLKSDRPEQVEIGRRVFADLRAETDAYVRGADALVVDSAYTEAEYRARAGWGHSTHEAAYDMAARCGVRDLYFFHHDPTRTDSDLARIEAHYRRRARREGRIRSVQAAREGTAIEL